MTHLAKLTFKSVTKVVAHDPVVARRDKIVSALEEQQLVLAAALEETDYLKQRSKWMNKEHGEPVLVKTQRRVRAWIFAQDGGWNVQGSYGARVIAVDGKNNAVFVRSLKEVASVLDAFIAAAKAGELDPLIAAAALREPRAKPTSVRAAANA